MAYCKYICPIGPLTKAYSKSSFTWLSTYQESCTDCKTFECAQVCTHKQSPFLFDKNNSMGECTLCMDCAQACEAVRFEVKKPSSSLWSRIKKPKMIDIWVYILILAAATIAMRFHHALGRSGLAPEMPWSILGNKLKDFTGLTGVDWVGFVAFFLALAITLVLTLGGYYLSSKISKIPFKTIMLTLGYSLAPLMLLGAFDHIWSFFFYHYASDIATGYLWLIGDNSVIEPLASRKDAWVRIFAIFPYLAAVWSFLILFKRIKLLELTTLRAKIATFVLSGAVIWFYLFLIFFTVYAFATYGAMRHH